MGIWCFRLDVGNHLRHGTWLDLWLADPLRKVVGVHSDGDSGNRSSLGLRGAT